MHPVQLVPLSLDPPAKMAFVVLTDFLVPLVRTVSLVPPDCLVPVEKMDSTELPDFPEKTDFLALPDTLERMAFAELPAPPVLPVRMVYLVLADLMEPQVPLVQPAGPPVQLELPEPLAWPELLVPLVKEVSLEQLDSSEPLELPEPLVLPEPLAPVDSMVLMVVPELLVLPVKMDFPVHLAVPEHPLLELPVPLVEMELPVVSDPPDQSAPLVPPVPLALPDHKE